MADDERLQRGEEGERDDPKSLGPEGGPSQVSAGGVEIGCWLLYRLLASACAIFIVMGAHFFGASTRTGGSGNGPLGACQIDILFTNLM